MQSKVSEEVDMGTALLRTWKSEALKPARRVLSEKVKVFRCINVSDLEKRVNGRVGERVYGWNFIQWVMEGTESKMQCT